MYSQSLESIKAELEGHGISFSQSSQIHTGKYSVLDAEWNYKDVPHLGKIHSQVNAVVTYLGDGVSNSMFVQSLGPIKIILNTFLNCDSNEQNYFTSVGPFVLLVNSRWAVIDEANTRVTTTYFVGTPKWMKVIRPVIHQVLARNYKILMSEDTPMRLQRGYLRRRGYSFRGDSKGYSFADSLQISKTNLISPAFPETQIEIQIVDVDGDRKEFWDENGERSLIAYRSGGDLCIGPSICPHEGAPLNGSNCESTYLECPWHGKQLKPWAKVDVITGASIIDKKDEIRRIDFKDRFITLHLPAKLPG